MNFPSPVVLDVTLAGEERILRNLATQVQLQEPAESCGGPQVWAVCIVKLDLEGVSILLVKLCLCALDQIDELLSCDLFFYIFLKSFCRNFNLWHLIYSFLSVHSRYQARKAHAGR